MEEPSLQGAACVRQAGGALPVPIPITIFSTDLCVSGGGNSLRPYSQQRPMRTNLSCCLGLTDNGQYKSTNRLLVLVPHERPHGIMRILVSGLIECHTIEEEPCHICDTYISIEHSVHAHVLFVRTAHSPMSFASKATVPTCVSERNSKNQK